MTNYARNHTCDGASARACTEVLAGDHRRVAALTVAPGLPPEATSREIDHQLNGGLMIRLDLKREPYWLDLAPGVRIRVRPCTTALVMAARASMTTAEPAPGPDSGDENARGAAMLN